MSANQHVVDYLQYYCESSTTDFAILVNGKWGAGKSHLVKEFLTDWAKQATDRRVLIASFHGVTNFRQIDAEFYRQLHPILASKGMKLLGKIGRGALKATTKIDLDGDGTADLTVSPQLPEIDLSEYSATPQGTILVFDDVERSTLQISDILGYINGYVEILGFKAIVIADESKITDKSPEYADIKEKLIGQTLRINSDVKGALPGFIDKIERAELKTLMSQRTDEIEYVFAASETNNLRLLKRGIWLLERLSAHFTDEQWQNRDGIAHFCFVFLALSLEVWSGRVQQSELGDFFVDEMTLYLREQNGKLITPVMTIRERYSMVNFNSFPLSLTLLRNVLLDGFIDNAEIQQALNNSAYFSNPTTDPAWKIAWHSFNASDDEFEAAVETVEREFLENDHWEVGTLLHFVGLRLRFSKMGAIAASVTEVKDQAIALIDRLVSSGKLPLFDEEGSPLDSGSDGLGYHEVSSFEFGEFFSHYRAKVGEVRRSKYPAEALELLQIMQDDVTFFSRKIYVNNFETSPYCDVPILSYIEPTRFVDDLLRLTGAGQVKVFSALKIRYQSSGLKGNLRPELPWLENVVKLLEERAESLRPATKDRVENLLQRDVIPYIKSAS